eukprot:Partr_v1_DN5091_c0_g1_i1_m31316
MLRICTRPSSSGRPISTCTSRRPGRMMASSIMSLRLVMPMSSTLLSESTPSILDSSWFTIESLTPVPPPDVPRCLAIASNSSKMMMCRSLSSPASACSFSASANRLRMFSSDWPTYLLRISGPLTILGGCACSALPIWRAISVLPQPGGPYSSMPRTWRWPILRSSSGGTVRDANARRKMSWNSAFRPPMPSASKLKPLENSCEPLPDDDPVSLSPGAPPEAALRSCTSVCRVNRPNLASRVASSFLPPPPRSMYSKPRTVSLRPTAPSWKPPANVWPTLNTWLWNVLCRNAATSCASSVASCVFLSRSTSSCTDAIAKLPRGGENGVTGTPASSGRLPAMRCIMPTPMEPGL